MNRTIIVGISVFFAILAIAVMGDQNEATADWGCFGCYGNSDDCQGCYGSACHSCAGSAQACYGCYGTPRSSQRRHRGLFSLFHHARRDDCNGGGNDGSCSCAGVAACAGCYGECYGGGCYGCCGGCGGCYGGCYGMAVVGEETTAAYALETEFAPAQFEVPSEMPAETVTPTPAESDTTMRGKAIMHIHVPTKAKVFENGRTTVTTGSDRRFEAVDLKRGTLYRYEFRAELAQGGKLLTQRKVVLVQSGQNVDVNFDFTADGAVSSRQRATPVWRQ